MYVASDKQLIKFPNDKRFELIARKWIEHWTKNEELISDLSTIYDIFIRDPNILMNPCSKE